MDRRVLYATAFVRAFTTGLVSVLLGVYLAREGLSDQAIGVVISSGLTGAMLAAFIATFFADRIGRRRYLIMLAVLSSVGTAAFALTSGAFGFAAAAFVGMLNGHGKDRGAGLILEQSVLPSTTTEGNRTRVIAQYTMLQDIGHAVGGLIAGAPTLLMVTGLRETEPHRATLLGCAVLGLSAVVLYLRLGRGIEVPPEGRLRRIDPRSSKLLTKISALFAVDSLAGGFVTSALVSYFFFERFAVSEAVLGALFFAARLLNAASHLGAAWLARRIGLVNTMVFTHIPSSLLLIGVAFGPTFSIAAILFLLREGLVEMDVPTRQSYVLAVVRPEERTIASGVTTLVRLAAVSIAPAFAGLLMADGSLYVPLVVGSSMKIVYDLLLWRAFRGIRPPEEMT